MPIAVLSVSYKTAPVTVRERVSLSPDQVRQLLRVIREEGIFDEAVILSTCNRTEIYSSGGDETSVPHLLEHLGQLKGAPAPEASLLVGLRGLPAVTHLFRVAATLESQIVGEHEIMGQVKEAYRLAVEARTARFLFNKLMHRAFHVGSRIAQETRLGQGAAGVASAAVDLARQIFTSLAGKTVLLVGAGQTAEAAAVNLISAGAGTLIVANRTFERGQQLAQHLARRFNRPAAPPAGAADAGGQIRCPAWLKYVADHCSLFAPAAPARALATRAIRLDEIASVIGQVGLVVSSTGSSEPVLRSAELGAVLARSGQPLLIVDIAVPRDAEAKLGELSNVFLYNIDDLDRLVAENLDRRRQEVPLAEAIIEYEVEQFDKWLRSLAVVPTIKRLQQHVEALQLAEIERYGRRFGPERRQDLEAFARGLCGKILHDPIAFLRQASTNGGEGDLAAADMVRRMFGLTQDEQDEEKPE